MFKRTLSLFLLPFLLSGCQAVNPDPKPIELAGIKIETPPDRTTYMIGEPFDPAGVKIKQVMSDGSIGDSVECYTYTPFDPLKTSDKEVTFMYKKFTAVQPITVTDDIFHVSSIEKFDDGRSYLQVDGMPYSIKGAQLRVDGLVNRSPFLPDAPKALTYPEMEKYFIAAENAHLNTIELGIQWKDIEKEKDVYKFDLVDALLEHANKHNLKCEILWFASNMCGDTREYQLPDYIFKDPVNYPRLEVGKPVGYSHMYGDCIYLKLDEPLYMERERKVIYALMDHIYDWNMKNGKKNPVIGIQVHNEADGLVRWRRDQREIKDGDGLISYNKLWNMTLAALDNAGKAFKASKYQVYTRCNMTTTCGISEFPQCPDAHISPLDVLHLQGIDIIGDDPYVTSPGAINSTMRKYRVENNLPHVAENMGNYPNSASLFLTAFQAGGNYMFYDLATPEYFVYLNGGGSYQMDQGIYKPDLTFKDHSEATFDIVKGISSMGCILPKITTKNFAAFNVKSEDPKQNITQTINTSNIAFTFNANNGAIGFAIEDGEYAYLCSNKDATISIDNATYAPFADVGHFEKDEYVIEEKSYPTDKFYLSKGKLYRVKITKILNQVTSTTDENV